jgi:hypothetical protein
MIEDKKIRIINGNLNESVVVDDGLPRGDGAGTQNSSIEVIIAMRIEIEKFLEEKYDCFKSILANESSRKADYTTEVEETSGSNNNIPYLGFPFGPGVIGDNRDGKKKGYSGKSNLFVGVPDKKAEDLSKKLETIIKEEKAKFEATTNENCKETTL